MTQIIDDSIERSSVFINRTGLQLCAANQFLWGTTYAENPWEYVVQVKRNGETVCSIDRRQIDFAACDPPLTPLEISTVPNLLVALTTQHFAEDLGGGSSGDASEATLQAILAAMNSQINGTTSVMLLNTQDITTPSTFVSPAKLWSISIVVNPMSTAYPTIGVTGGASFVLTDTLSYNMSAPAGKTLPAHSINIPSGCILTVQTLAYP